MGSLTLKPTLFEQFKIAKLSNDKSTRIRKEVKKGYNQIFT